MFYRKMYAKGIILILISLMCSALSIAVIYGIYGAEVKSANKAIDSHMEYAEAVLAGEIDHKTDYFPEDFYNGLALIESVGRKIDLLDAALSFALSLGVGIFANALYKSHLKKKLETCNGYYAGGGVSVGAVFACLGISFAANLGFTVLSEFLIKCFTMP